MLAVHSLMVSGVTVPQAKSFTLEAGNACCCRLGPSLQESWGLVRQAGETARGDVGLWNQPT